MPSMTVKLESLSPRVESTDMAMSYSPVRYPHSSRSLPEAALQREPTNRRISVHRSMSCSQFQYPESPCDFLKATQHKSTNRRMLQQRSMSVSLYQSPDSPREFSIATRRESMNRYAGADQEKYVYNLPRYNLRNLKMMEQFSQTLRDEPSSTYFDKYRLVRNAPKMNKAAL
jgi:hypothetical protein